MSIELTKCQVNAKNEIVHWFNASSAQVFMLTGYAGTGKTTLLKYLINEVLCFNEDQVAVITPTGKAATVLIRKGIPATTLHRFMYIPRVVQELVVDQFGHSVMAEKLKFEKIPSVDKSIKLIVLDEASMVSDKMFKDLLSFNKKILMCGDDAQLPPVEGFNSFIKRPNCTLTTIVRQVADNPIVQLADACRHGKDLPYGNWKNVAMVMRSSDFTGQRRANLLMHASQVLCGTNRLRASINDEIRAHLGCSAVIEDGEKLICVKNNWDEPVDKDHQYSFVNGMVGYARSLRRSSIEGIGELQFEPEFLPKQYSPTVYYDNKYLCSGEATYKDARQGIVNSKNGYKLETHHPIMFEYGYCISVHKSQGSEFQNVVVFDESYCFKDDKYRWLYTAITRAKNKLIVLR